MKNLYHSGQGFPWASYTLGNLSSSPYGGTSAREQSVNGGPYEGDIDLMEGPNFDRLYHKLKVLLLLSCITRCNLSAMILLKLVDLRLIAFKCAQ